MAEPPVAAIQALQKQYSVEPRTDVMAYVLAVDYLRCRLLQEHYEWFGCPVMISSDNVPAHVEAMRIECTQCESRYGDSFREMVDSLRITPSSLFATFIGVCDEVFIDGITWARIVSLYAFTAVLAVKCYDLEMPHLVSRLAKWLGNYVELQLGEWIIQHKGWDGLVEFSKIGNLQPIDAVHNARLRRLMGVSLGITVGAVTLGAILAGRA